MKNLFSIVVIVIFCNILSAQKSVELKFNLEKGKKYSVQSSSVANQNMTVQGMERSTETKSISYMSLKMLDSKPEFFIAEVKFDTVKTITSMPPMEISSNNQGDIKSDDIVSVTSCILNRFANSTMVVRMDYKGFVLDILNYNVIKETMLAGTDSLRGMVALAKGQLETMADKKTLIGMIESVTAYLPNKEVAPGEDWDFSYSNTNGMGEMAVTGTYKLKSLNNGVAVIEGENAFKPVSNEPMMMNGSEITNEISGLGKTTMEVNPETGWLIKSSTKIQMAGNMIVNAQGNSMTIPIQSVITNEIKAVE